MKHIIILFITSIYFTVTNTQAQQVEDRHFSGFNKVSVGQSIQLELTQGNENKARISVEGMDIEDLLTEVNNGKLTIRLRSNKNYRNSSAIVYLTYKELTHLDLSSSSKVKTTNTLRSENLNIQASSSAKGNLNVDVRSLKVNINSSAKVDIEGRAIAQEIEISSSGRYTANHLESKDVVVDVSSSGSCDLLVTERLEATASSSGTIYYTGNPKEVNTSTNSSGKISKS